MKITLQKTYYFQSGVLRLFWKDETKSTIINVILGLFVLMTTPRVIFPAMSINWGYSFGVMSGLTVFQCIL